MNDVALTGPDGGNPWMRDPNPFGGYQFDAEVRDAAGAGAGCAGQSRPGENAPSQQLLDDLAAFQRVLFTNHRVQALADAIREGSGSLPDPDPRLDALEQQGKVVFERACAQCHGGPGQSTTFAPIVRFHDIVESMPATGRPARGAFSFEACGPQLARNARTYEITMPNGTKVRRTSSDPGRALLTGVVGGPPPLDDWNKLDVPGLRGIRNTAPYFHNNSAASLEAVVDHYIEFFKFVRANALPGVFPPIASTDGQHFDRIPLPEERAALLAYLRKL